MLLHAFSRVSKIDDSRVTPLQENVSEYFAYVKLEFEERGNEGICVLRANKRVGRPSTVCLAFTFFGRARSLRPL